MFDYFLRSFRRRNAFKSSRYSGSGFTSDSTNSLSGSVQRKEDVQIFEGDPGFRIRIDFPRPLIDTARDLELSDQTELIDALEQILAKQDADANMRSADSYYGNTGKWVRLAAWDARKAVNDSLEEAIKLNSLDPILLSVARALSGFCDYCGGEDEDGYGVATFGEILQDLLALQKSRGEPAKFDLEMLCKIGIGD